MDPQVAQLSEAHMLPPSRPQSRLRDILNLSDRDIRQNFFPFGTDLVEDDETPNIWSAHLEAQGHTTAFMPLEGSERTRYGSIIENAVDQELYEQMISMDAWFSIPRTQLSTRQQINNRNLTPLQRWGPGRPVALEDLQEFCERPPRHIKQTTQFPGKLYPTAFGEVRACTVLPEKDWYLGHRPGDPIIRIDDDPFEGQDSYLVHFEGVVPFNKAELMQRFTKDAYPKLAKIALAAVTFNPLNRDIHPWATMMAEAIDLQFDHSQAQANKTSTIKLLHRLWTMKYGSKMDNYPFFLQLYLGIAWPAFREIAWLLNQLKATHDSICTSHLWANCKNLVQKMSGADIDTLAAEHRDVTLAWEAFNMLNLGQFDDVVIYTQREGAKRVCVTFLFGLNSPLSFREVSCICRSQARAG
ncbi:hypothetical protein F4680DRAFT_417936 [Xylaria scruposa]|nr:hypothetical protein F4680DRAFT_417936 [Xylaria scruposa]